MKWMTWWSAVERSVPRRIRDRWVPVSAVEVLEQRMLLSIDQVMLFGNDTWNGEGNSGTTRFTFDVYRSGDCASAATVDYSVRGGGEHPADAADFGDTNLFDRSLVDYGSDGWRYQQVAVGGLEGFQSGAEPDGFADGQAGFGNYAESGLTPRGGWELDSDMLLRREVTLGSGELLKVAVAIDNDVEVWVNGVEISGGMVQSEGVAVHDRFAFVAPADVGHVGTNLVAIRARDRGCVNFIDARIAAVPEHAPAPPPVLPSGTVTFAPGESYAQIVIPVRGDTQLEFTEGFTVTLSNASRQLEIIEATAEGVIEDDEPVVGVYSSNAFRMEGNSGSTNFTFWVYRGGNTNAPLSVDYSVIGSGENPADPVDFGDANRFDRPIVNYGSDGWRYQQVEVGTLEGFQSGPEPSGFMEGTAGFGNWAETGLSWRTPWSLYSDLLLRREVTLGAGERLKVAVAIDNDVEVWINGVEISGGMVQSEGVATHDRFAFLAPSDVAHEGVNLVAIRARDRGGASFIDARIAAVPKTTPELPPPTEFPSGTIRFEAGETWKVLSIPVMGDTTADANEQFSVVLANPSVSTRIEIPSADGIIYDEEPQVYLSASDSWLREGDEGVTEVIFWVWRSGDCLQSATVDYAVNGSGANPAEAADFGDGSQSNKDFLSGVIHFGPGDSMAQIVIPIHGDTLAERQEQFTVTLSNPSSGIAIGGATADVMICNDDWNILPQTTSNGEDSKLIIRRLVNYGSPGWRYQQVEIGGLEGFERGPEPRGFATGRAGFGDYAEEGLQCNSAWSLDTDMLLRRNVILRPGEWLGIAVAIDNDVEVWVNGVEVSGGMMQSEYMAVHDRFMFAVPADVVRPGKNLIAIRARDRGCANFIDARIIAISDGSRPPPEPPPSETLPPVNSLVVSDAALIPADEYDFEEDTSSDDSNWIQTGALLDLTDIAGPTEFNQPNEAETIATVLNESVDEPVVTESDFANNSSLEEEAFLTTDGWLDLV